MKIDDVTGLTERICQEYGFHFDLYALVRDLPIAVQQQVEIVKVLYRHAEIIILDEPTAIYHATPIHTAFFFTPPLLLPILR